MKNLTLALGLLVTILGLSLPVSAQDIRVEPQLYDVIGVASDDVLNVRETPSANSSIVGMLSHQAHDVEVIALNASGKWGLVNTDEQSGWVSMRFMRLSPIEFEPPVDLSCSGTEPFWFLDFTTANSGRADWSFMGLTSGGSVYNQLWFDRPANRITQSYAFRLTGEASGSDVNASGIIRTEMCNDGMSDREYGFTIDVILTGNQPMFVSGCCSIAN